MKTRDESKSGFSLSGLPLVIALGLAALLFFGGMKFEDSTKKSPHTTPGPTAPQSGRVTIEGTSAPCTFCQAHDGIVSDNALMTDGSTDCSVCKRTALVDVTMPGKLASLSASARKLIADATSKAIGSDAKSMKADDPKDGVVDLDGADGLHITVNSKQSVDSLGSETGDLASLNISKLPADVQTRLADAEKEIGAKPHDYTRGKKGHLKSNINLGDKQCVEHLFFWE